MKIIIDNVEELLRLCGDTTAEIKTHSFLLKVGDVEFRFVEGDAGQLQVYSGKSVHIEPRASNCFYVWSIK
mgnify:CR=1 FL=1